MLHRLLAFNSDLFICLYACLAAEMKNPYSKRRKLRLRKSRRLCIKAELDLGAGSLALDTTVIVWVLNASPKDHTLKFEAVRGDWIRSQQSDILIYSYLDGITVGVLGEVGRSRSVAGGVTSVMSHLPFSSSLSSSLSWAEPPLPHHHEPKAPPLHTPAGYTNVAWSWTETSKTGVTISPYFTWLKSLSQWSVTF